MKSTLVTAAVVVSALALPLAACSNSGPATATPPKATVTVTGLAPSPSQRTTLNFDDLNMHLACFDLGTYRAGKRANDPKIGEYAAEAQKSAGEVSDPQWSEVALLPADEAMQRLAELCKEIHYHE
jgi:hypothetical protein